MGRGACCIAAAGGPPCAASTRTCGSASSPSSPRLPRPLGAIDDATSQVLALHFRPTEDLHGYATLLHQVFTAHGLPVALYGDGVNILVRTDRHWRLEEELAGVQAPTHLGRVLQDLGIAYVQARSPQGKGRIERLWGTLQDR